MLAGFRNAYVFDVSQTDGAELPTIHEIGGDVGENRERLFAFVEKQGIELSFSDSIAPALGMSYGGRIALLPGQRMKVDRRPRRSMQRQHAFCFACNPLARSSCQGSPGSSSAR
jgi:hypothetical protein